MGWHYETAAEARERTAKRKSMSKEAYRAYENEEQRRFNANPANRHKAGSAADRRRRS
jgi:hypothetical protein